MKPRVAMRLVCRVHKVALTRDLADVLCCRLCRQEADRQSPPSPAADKIRIELEALGPQEAA